jgi:hypothetical protein
MALQKLRPSSEFTYHDNNYDSITWIVLEGKPPTQAEIDKAIKQIKADEITEAAKKATQRQAILDRLGITSEEARILLS